MHTSLKEASECSLSTQVDSQNQISGSKLENFLKYCKNYTNVLFFGTKYEVGSDVYVKTQKLQSECVGKIQKIMVYPQSNNSLVPLVQIQWYCSKYDVSERYKEYFEYFSDYELFLTELSNILFLDCISKKFTVLPLDEFDKLDEVPQDTYFCRAHYEIKKQILTPPINEWNKTCKCKKPQNPDLLYIQCDFCKIWFHLQCIGMTQEQANKIESYKCTECIK